MPTYEYECGDCGHSFEAFQAMSDEPLKTCPECGKEVRRLIFGGAGVIFKGSGFYVTDRKGSGGKDKGAGDKAACASCPAASSGAGCPAAAVPDSGGGSKNKAASAASA